MLLTGSNFEFDHLSEKYNTALLKKIKVYAGKGKTLVLRNLDCIYPALYDLFNKRFALYKTSKQLCSVSYEEYRDKILVHADFKVVLVKSEDDLFAPKADMERLLPSPLINRFEKHIIKQSDVFQSGLDSAGLTSQSTKRPSEESKQSSSGSSKIRQISRKTKGGPNSPKGTFSASTIRT